MHRVPETVVCRILSLLTLDEHFQIRATSHGLGHSSRRPAAAPARVDATAYDDTERRQAMLRMVTAVRSPHLAIAGHPQRTKPIAYYCGSQVLQRPPAPAAGVTGVELAQISRMTWLHTLEVDLVRVAANDLGALIALHPTLTSLHLCGFDDCVVDMTPLSKLLELRRLSVEWYRNHTDGNNMRGVIEPLRHLQTLTLHCLVSQSALLEAFSATAVSAAPSFAELRHLRLDRCSAPLDFLHGAHTTLRGIHLETLVAADADATRTQLVALLAAQPTLGTLEFLQLVPDDVVRHLAPDDVAGEAGTDADRGEEAKRGAAATDASNSCSLGIAPPPQDRASRRANVSSSSDGGGGGYDRKYAQFPSLTDIVCSNIEALDTAWLCKLAPAIVALKVGVTGRSTLRDLRPCAAPSLCRLLIGGVADDRDFACLARLRAPQLAALAVIGKPYMMYVIGDGTLIVNAGALHSLAAIACFPQLATLRLQDVRPVAAATLPRLERLTTFAVEYRPGRRPRATSESSDTVDVVDGDDAVDLYRGPSAERLRSAFPRLDAYEMRRLANDRESAYCTTLVDGHLVSATVRRDSCPTRSSSSSVRNSFSLTPTFFQCL